MSGGRSVRLGYFIGAPRASAVPATELAGSRVRIRIRRRDTIGKDVRDGWVDRNAPGGARPRRGGSTSWLRDPGATARPGRPIGSLLPTRGTRSRRRVRCTRRSHRAQWCARRCCTPHEPRALRATTSDTVAVGVMSTRLTRIVGYCEIATELPIALCPIFSCPSFCKAQLRGQDETQIDDYHPNTEMPGGNRPPTPETLKR